MSPQKEMLGQKRGWMLVTAVAALAVLSHAPGCRGRDSRSRQGATEATAPALQGGDGSDGADRKCRVVLREAERLPAETGYATECVAGRCWFVWAAWVDISEQLVAEGSQPAVVYRSGSDPTWWESHEFVELAGQAPEGFHRFRVRFYEHTASPGTSLTSLMGTRIELAVFAQMDGGGRLFDHNRLDGDFENYLLDAENTWSVSKAPAVCATEPISQATLEFLPGYRQRRHGALVGGGTLRIEYALSRLSECRASNTFAPAWDIEAHVRFWPSGQIHTESVVEFETDEQGQTHDVAHPKPIEVDIPPGAEHAEIWFHNHSGMSNPCDAWDSNYGQNYHFEVVSTAPSSAAWAGDWGNGFNRACEHRAGLAEPVLVDSYLMQRACLFVDADVYVPGVTDSASLRPGDIAAQVELSKDGGPWQRQWLDFQGRVGNNYRFRWTLPRQELFREEWNQIRYAFRFSTDGIHWFRVGQNGGPGGGEARTLLRDFPHSGWDD